MSRVSARFSSKRSFAWLYLAPLFGLAVGCVEQAEDKPTKEDEEFIKRNLLSAPPTPQFPVNADLDGKVVYLGMDVSPVPVEAGKDVRVTHYWKVNVAPGEGWKMFTHITGTNKQGYANVDHVPVSGKYPAAKWKAGDIVRDQHTFRPPAAWNYDHLEIYSGLYRGQERLPVRSGPKDENRVFCGRVPMNVKAPPPLKRYVATKITKPIKLDGKMDEPAWKAAPSTGAFVDTMNGGPVPVATEAKLLWDNQNLYIGFENQDSDVWSSLTARDDKLWTQEAVEVMIDADGNGKTYIELQVNPNGTLFDTYLPTYRKYEDSIDPKRKLYDWSSKVKVAVKVDGTVSKRDDQDKSWTVEMAVPLADVNGLDKPGVKVPPALGDIWRVNMFRLDSPKDKPQVAAAWSPPLVGDFHKLDRFGQVVFGDEKGEVPAPKPAVVDDKGAKDEKKPEGAKADKAAKDEKKADKGAKDEKKPEGAKADKAKPAKQDEAK